VTGATPNAPARSATSLREIVREGRDRLGQSRSIVLLSTFGIVVGIFCLALNAMRGGAPIGVEGDLTKPASFDIAVGIYLLTLAMLYPSARFTPRGSRHWIGWTIALFLYGFLLETVQTFRGIDPRFSHVGSLLDGILGSVFGLVAIGFIVLFVVLARQFFRDRTDSRSPVTLAIRYGCVATLAAFAAGIWMSVIQGRHTGSAGNILALHALGFHGLQAIPVVALLLGWSGADAVHTRRWVHAAGITWLVVCAAVAYQTFIGHSVYERAPAMIVGVFMLVVWAAIAAFAFWGWLRLPATPRVSRDISKRPTASS
jgi:hypothetical protein